MPWFILIFIEPSRSLPCIFQHSPLNSDENWDVTNLPHLRTNVWGRGGGRHGVVPAVVRSPVVGPACRACVSESESERGWGWQGGASASFIDKVRRFARRRKKSRPALCVTTPIYGEVGAAIFAGRVI